MELYFQNEHYREKALFLAEHRPESTHTLEEAVLLCLKTADRTQLRNLCKKMQSRFPGLTEQDCFLLTRGEAVPGKTDCTPAVLREIYRLALELLESGQGLGDGNASLWGHWFLESRAAGRLAENAHLDGDTARKLGLLHDFGRTVTGTLEHTVRGFELLTDLGWDFEALGCLTHSFLAGGRCASNEQAEKGFYVDDRGLPRWRPGSVKDDVTVFLEHCTYTEYDLILNIADLMVSAWAILPPAERLADIATRRVLDPTNRSYFLAELTNQLWNLARKISPQPLNVPAPIHADRDTSPADIQACFSQASQAFFGIYRTLPE